MDDWQLLPRPERVTELYFTDHRQLSAAASPDAAQTVRFTVHNLEHQPTVYHYTLTAMSEGDTIEHRLGSGNFSLAHNRSQAIHKPITLPLLKGRIAVKVSLEYEGIALGDSTPSLQKQSIHYWAAPTDTSGGDKKENREGT